MARSRSPDREKAFEIYKQHNGNIDLVEIAKQLDLPPGTIRGWKNKDKWSEQLNGTLQKNTERSRRQKQIKPEHNNGIRIENNELTEKQRLFCLYYIKNANATLAAIRAGYSPDSATQIGYENMTKPYVRAEIERLKAQKRQAIMLDPDDIVERYMKIAFADMTDFVEFGQEDVPVMTMFGPLEIEDPETGEKIPVTKRVNVVKFKASNEVDGGLICQIKQGKDGAALKLEDRQKALDWLANFFEMNPQHKHRVWFDTEKLKIEREKVKKPLGDDKPIEIVIKRKGDAP